MYYIKGNIITNGEILKDTYVEIVGDKITYVGNDKRKEHYPVHDVEEGFICPGLIDIHIHAVSGYDFMDNDAAFAEITKKLPQYGVTSVLATSRTGSLADIESLLDTAKEWVNKKEAGSQIIGVHLEGPWISRKYSGAQPKKYIQKLGWKSFEHIIEPYADAISQITLAPEELTDFKIIDQLKGLNINVSAGHTAATIEEIAKSIEHGLNLITHTFNAMSPVHHREAGTAAAALLYDDLYCEVIADGLHVHPRIIELLYKTKGKERMILISDCTGYDHLADGAYHIREKDIIKKGNRVTLPNGTLAGSTITLDKAIKYAVEQCHIPLADAVYMATQTPLDTLKSNHLKRGRIKEDYEADIIILDSDLNVKITIIDGKIVYKS